MPSSFFTIQTDPVREDIPMENVVEDVIEDMPVSPGGWSKLNAQGRTLKSTLHPLLSQGWTWISEMNNRSQLAFVSIYREASHVRERHLTFYLKNFYYTPLKCLDSVSPRAESRSGLSTVIG